MDKTTAIVDKMMDKDLFSQWLGIERIEERRGYCKLRMTVRPEMCNGFEIAHGGITYSFADSAFAFASNSQGRHAVSIETYISHIHSDKPGDILDAIAEEKNLSNKLGIYEVKVFRGQDLVALFKGTVFRKETEWHI